MQEIHISIKSSLVESINGFKMGFSIVTFSRNEAFRSVQVFVQYLSNSDIHVLAIFKEMFLFMLHHHYASVHHKEEKLPEVIISVHNVTAFMF